jgi:transposase-like protein
VKVGTEQECAVVGEQERVGSGKALEPWQRPVEELCCVNPGCPLVGQRGAENLTVRKGKGGKRWRMLRCSACKKEFSERKGTALFGSRLEPEKFVAIAEHLKEGVGMRATARLCKVNRITVARVALASGIHGRALHEEQARGLEVDEAQMDEKWSFVKKNRNTATRSRPKKTGTETNGIT